MINPPQVLPEEPTAVTPHGGFCGGKSQQWLRYPTNPLVRICEGESRMAELLDRDRALPQHNATRMRRHAKIYFSGKRLFTFVEIATWRPRIWRRTRTRPASSR